jgi:hypothetical protein
MTPHARPYAVVRVLRAEIAAGQSIVVNFV